MYQQGFARCLQGFAHDPRIADVFAMFAKMFYNFADVQKCLQIYESVQKCLQKNFLWGG